MDPTENCSIAPFLGLVQLGAPMEAYSAQSESDITHP